MDLNAADWYPKKYIEKFKCECFQPYNFCICPQKIVGSNQFLDNVQSLAVAIKKVMTICGVHCQKEDVLKTVIIFYLLNYKEIRHRIDTIPHKRLHRLDLMHDLTCKCLISRANAQMAFSIIKRAFKAFYYGTDEGGTPKPLFNNALKHSQRCLWHYAAYRTAQIYAAYENMFPICQKNIQYKINAIYFKTYKDFKVTLTKGENYECICLKCFKNILADNLRRVASREYLFNNLDVYDKLYYDMIVEARRNGSMDRGEKYFDDVSHDCNCSILDQEDEEGIRADFNIVNTGFSQGPFECRWYNITKEEAEAEDAKLDFEFYDEFQCPPNTCNVDDDSDSCESICECTCESCECHSETEIETSDEILKKEGNEIESPLSTFGINVHGPKEAYAGCHIPGEFQVKLKTLNKNKNKKKMKKLYVSNLPVQTVTKTMERPLPFSPKKTLSSTTIKSTNMNTSETSQYETTEEIVKFILSGIIEKLR